MTTKSSNPFKPLSRDELFAEIEQGRKDYEAGKSVPADEAIAKLHAEFDFLRDIEISEEQIARGETVPMSEALEEIRAKYNLR